MSSQLGEPSDSTCSRDSYLRGAGQKVIGFSFYGNPNSTKGKERKYFKVGRVSWNVVCRILLLSGD